MPDPNSSKTVLTDDELPRVGVIHGRFQILHNDHLKYLLAGKARCEHLVIGITNPDPTLTRDDSADPKRTTRISNPLTYFERYIMVGDALVEAGVRREDFSVVPFPISLPALYRYYVPTEAVFYMTVCDEWGERKLKLLQSQGLNVNVMWRRTPETKGLQGSEIRGRIIDGRPWDHLVPRSTAILIRVWQIADRLKEIRDGGTQG